MAMEIKSAWVTIDGLPLRVDYEYHKAEEETPCIEPHVEVIQAWLEGWEVLSIMADDKIGKIRQKLLNGEAREAE